MNRRPIGRKPAKESATLFDRIAIGAFSGLCSLGLGSFIWFMLSLRWWGPAPIPFHPVLYGSAAVAVLGFLLAENVVTTVLAVLLDLLFGLARFW